MGSFSIAKMSRLMMSKLAEPHILLQVTAWHALNPAGKLYMRKEMTILQHVFCFILVLLLSRSR